MDKDKVCVFFFSSLLVPFQLITCLQIIQYIAPTYSLACDHYHEHAPWWFLVAAGGYHLSIFVSISFFNAT